MIESLCNCWWAECSWIYKVQIFRGLLSLLSSCAVDEASCKMGWVWLVMLRFIFQGIFCSEAGRLQKEMKVSKNLLQYLNCIV